MAAARRTCALPTTRSTSTASAGFQGRGGRGSHRARAAVVRQLLCHAEPVVEQDLPCRGRPFFYYAVTVKLGGGGHADRQFKLLRADVLHDVGRSLNLAMGVGCDRGAAVQGMGWL
ncbi:Xanthine dehydrogenase/oxidase [Manis javanica]|nr:Xanthine dehydrogenase/oxidase [Manis javanica]